MAGINTAIAKNIVAQRENAGPYKSRKELLKVPRLGPKAFEQCAGFLRLPGGKEPLDATAVHPESYTAAAKLLALCGFTAADIGTAALDALEERIRAYGREKLAKELGIGLPTLADIAAELRRPGRDMFFELEQFFHKTNSSIFRRSPYAYSKGARPLQTKQKATGNFPRPPELLYWKNQKQRKGHIVCALSRFSNSRTIYGGAVETLDPYYPYYIGNLIKNPKREFTFYSQFNCKVSSPKTQPSLFTKFYLAFGCIFVKLWLPR